MRQLRAEVRRLQQERDILKKALAIFTHDAVSPYRFIQAQTRHYPARRLCQVLGVVR